MDKVEEILDNYYNNYDEDSRLIRDKSHMVEYNRNRCRNRKIFN